MIRLSLCHRILQPLSKHTQCHRWHNTKRIKKICSHSRKIHRCGLWNPRKFHVRISALYECELIKCVVTLYARRKGLTLVKGTGRVLTATRHRGRNTCLQCLVPAPIGTGNPYTPLESWPIRQWRLAYWSAYLAFFLDYKFWNVHTWNSKTLTN